MKHSKESFLDLWYAALASPFGVEVDCSDFEQVRQALYRARQDARDEDLKALAVCQSPFDANLLWIVKREPDHATP